MNRFIQLLIIFVVQFGSLKKAIATELLRGNEVSLVFVGGFLGEGLKNNFKYNLETLRNTFGVDRFYEIQPASVMTVMEGAQIIAQKVQEVSLSDKRPVILIGHSKGGAEVLYAMMTKLNLQKQVSAAIVIQGSIGGSPLTEPGFGLKAIGLGLSEQSEKGFQKFFGSTALAGFMTMTPSFSQPLFFDAKARLEESSVAFQSVSSKIHYVRSTQDPSKQSEVLATGGRFLNRFYGSNDGMVLLEDQMLAGVGHDLFLPIDADHADIVSWGRHITNNSPREKVEITKKIFRGFLK